MARLKLTLLQEWTRKAWLAGLLLLLTVVTLILARVTSCSEDEKAARQVTVTQPPAAEEEPEDGVCDSLALGDTEETQCPVGQSGRLVAICTAEGLVDAVDTCTAVGPPSPPLPPTGCLAAGVTTFASIQPILARSCTSCHATFARFEVATVKIDEFIRRTSLKADQAQHMPRPPVGELPAADKALLADWKADGLCPVPPNPPVVTGNAFGTLAPLEARLLESTVSVEARLRKNVRHLVSVHSPAEAAETFRAAAAKTVNSLSSERLIQAMETVEPGIYRIDLDSLGLTVADWRLVEDEDKLDIESFTQQGELLKLISGARKPWLHVDNFDDVTLRNAKVYYTLTRTPSTFAQFTAGLGVDYAADLADFDGLLAGFVGSPLSPQNRMLSVHRSRDGTSPRAGVGGSGLWCTYDTGVLDTREKNLSEFPLLGDVGGVRNFQFIAGECLHVRPNGLLGHTLWAAKQTFRNVASLTDSGDPILDESGAALTRRVFVRSDLDARIDIADVAVVRDFLNPTSAAIQLESCFRCHSGGILPVADQIRDSTLANGSEFDDDKDRILAIYHAGGDLAGRGAATNATFATALAAMNIDPAAPDPISVVSDAFLTQWNLEKTARFLLMEPAQLQAALAQSATARAQVGQLAVDGGSIAYDQLVASLPVLKRELRLFQDPLAD